MTESSIHPLPWQLNIWRRLWQAQRQKRLPHAMLFVGPEGVGKTRFAQAIAQSLFCANPDKNGLSCGTCRHCHLFQAGNHPDFQQIVPDEGSKSGEIKIDTIRNLIGSAALTAQSGGYKLALVKPAERMNKSAANSLLKTLEEPVPNTIVILVSHQPSRLLPTIRSRCQHFNFPIPPKDQALAWLEDHLGSSHADTLLALSGGAPLKVLGLDPGEIIERRKKMLLDFSGIAMGRLDLVKIVAEWTKYDIDQLMDWLVGWVMDLLRLQVSRDPPLLYNRDELNTLQTIAEQLNSATLQRFLLQIYAVRNLMDSNLNSQLMLERLLIEWYACIGREAISTR